jgi:hypothetical protein
MAVSRDPRVRRALAGAGVVGAVAAVGLTLPASTQRHRDPVVPPDSGHRVVPPPAPAVQHLDQQPIQGLAGRITGVDMGEGGVVVTVQVDPHQQNPAALLVVGKVPGGVVNMRLSGVPALREGGAVTLRPGQRYPRADALARPGLRISIWGAPVRGQPTVIKPSAIMFGRGVRPHQLGG